jgi:hypothetical protein
VNTNTSCRERSTDGRPRAASDKNVAQNLVKRTQNSIPRELP